MTEGNKLSMFLYHCCGVKHHGRGEVGEEEERGELIYHKTSMITD